MSDFHGSFSGFGMDNQLYKNNTFNPTTGTSFNFNTFQNNSSQNFQNSFNLSEENQNQHFNMNNKILNNMNFNNDIPFSNFNFNGNKKEITIMFLFFGCLSFKVKAELEEKLIDVINRFKNNFKSNECPKEFKNDLYAAICHAERVKDFNKTLLELHIIDGDSILFLNTESSAIIKKKNIF